MKLGPIDILIAVAAAIVFFLAGQASANDAGKLADAKGCMACHAMDKKLVGPSYKDVAKKYKGNKDAQAALEKKVIDGGSGVWGAIPMPPHKGKLSDSEVKLLVQWIMAQ
ncbi:MAG TPA: c-type cytochrome [Burkholderiales bacterium]|jgi:cytochrome c|nr:c-type cytochrome [Burkholderiales bacterium]